MHIKMTQLMKAKSGTYIRWPIILATAFVLMFGGMTLAEDGVSPSILDGVMSELSEVRSFKGDIINHTGYTIHWAILSTDKGTNTPEASGMLRALEGCDISLTPGDYVLLALAFSNDGVYKGRYLYEFHVDETGNDDFGFDIRAGKPPVTL